MATHCTWVKRSGCHAIAEENPKTSPEKSSPKKSPKKQVKSPVYVFDDNFDEMYMKTTRPSKSKKGTKTKAPSIKAPSPTSNKAPMSNRKTLTPAKSPKTSNKVNKDDNAANFLVSHATLDAVLNKRQQTKSDAITDALPLAALRFLLPRGALEKALANPQVMATIISVLGQCYNAGRAQRNMAFYNETLRNELVKLFDSGFQGDAIVIAWFWHGHKASGLTEMAIILGSMRDVTQLDAPFYESNVENVVRAFHTGWVVPLRHDRHSSSASIMLYRAYTLAGLQFLNNFVAYTCQPWVIFKIVRSIHRAVRTLPDDMKSDYLQHFGAFEWSNLRGQTSMLMRYIRRPTGTPDTWYMAIWALAEASAVELSKNWQMRPVRAQHVMKPKPDVHIRNPDQKYVPMMPHLSIMSTKFEPPIVADMDSCTYDKSDYKIQKLVSVMQTITNYQITSTLRDLMAFRR